MELDDEILCAYLDEELDVATRERVTRALESDPGGRVRLERMRAADARLRRDVPPAAGPVDDPIAALIRRHETGGAGDAVPTRARRRWVVPLALAAAACVVALGVLFSTQRAPMEETYARGALQAALETRPSGVAMDSAGAAVTILLSVRSDAGAICRLFESRTATTAEGVACRDERGWKIVAWDGTVPQGSGFHTAAASPIVEVALDHLGGEPLDSAAERAALARGWGAD